MLLFALKWSLYPGDDQSIYIIYAKLFHWPSFGFVLFSQMNSTAFRFTGQSKHYLSLIHLFQFIVPPQKHNQSDLRLQQSQLPTHTRTRSKSKAKCDHTNNFRISRIIPSFWIKTERFRKVFGIIEYTFDERIQNSPFLKCDIIDGDIFGGHTIEQPLKNRTHSCCLVLDPIYVMQFFEIFISDVRIYLDNLVDIFH